MAMIIDAHAYCFEPIDSPAGHADGVTHLRWVQAAHAHHHQPAWRVRDRAPADATRLAPGGFVELDQLPDVHFRVDRDRGRVVWTVDGEDVTKQFFPPNLRDLEFTPHSLIAEMDYAGVDLALLHTDPMLGRDSAFLAGCVAHYPDRLRAMAPVDEWRIPTEQAAVIDTTRRAIETQGLHAIKFIPQLAYRAGPEPWDDGPYRPFWEAVVALKVPIFFTLGNGPEAGAGSTDRSRLQAGYLQELRIFTRWLERYPQAKCCLTHGFPWRLFYDAGHIELPEAIWLPFDHPGCSLEVCFPVRVGDLFDFPYREIWPVLELLVTRLGADRLLWGSDMPFQNRFCTYRQSRDWIEKYCSFLTPIERDAIMGGTAARLLSPDKV